jgi:hypothetical protein
MLMARSQSFLAALLAASSLAMSGCAGLQRPKVQPQTVAVTPPPTKADRWLAVANAEDIDRLSRLPSAWSEGLREARAGRFAAAIRDEGDLLRLDAALARPAPTPGSYYCRLVRLGRTASRSPAFERFKPFFCYVEVENDLLTIVKQTGSERPAGRLWEDDVATRLIFLGSLALGNEEQPKAYGEDPRRDMAGVVERIGPMRWRLVVPWPRSGAKLELFELTPVAEQPSR